MNLLDGIHDIIYANLSIEGHISVQQVHETSKRDQFLMKLRSDFEGIRSNLMKQNPPLFQLHMGSKASLEDGT